MLFSREPAHTDAAGKSATSGAIRPPSRIYSGAVETREGMCCTMRRWRAIRWFGATLAVMPVGCASVRGHLALEDGRYEDAVAAYDEALRQRSNHAPQRWFEKRQRARHAYVNERLRRIAALRRDGSHREATRTLEELLVRVGSWEVSEAASSAIERQIRVAAEDDHRRTRRALHEHGPLTAERSLPPAAMLLARGPYAEERRTVLREIAEAGAERCATASEVARARPFLASVARAYCEHFGAPLPEQLARPGACAGVEFTGVIAGETLGERGTMRLALTRAYAASPWVDPLAHCTHRVHVQGTRSDQTTTQKIRVAEKWTERVPYAATEMVSVAYTTSEHYTAMEAHTTYQSYSYSCGSHPPRTCTGSRPHTQYRSVPRTRSVTRHRMEPRTVTRYRDVPRVFEFEAEEVVHLYNAAGTIAFEGGGAAATWKFEERAVALNHDVVFAPAGIAPSRAPPPSRPAMFAREVDKAASDFASAMAEEFRRRHCEGVSSFDTDSAAACLLAAPATLPREAAAVLAEVFAGDVDEVAKLLAGR